MASGRSSFTGGHGSPSPLSTERIVKYMANSAAKNISSEDSQMIVPTLTRLGLLVGCARSYLARCCRHGANYYDTA